MANKKDTLTSYIDSIKTEVEQLPTLDKLCDEGEVGVIDHDELISHLYKFMDTIKDYVEEHVGAEIVKESSDDHSLSITFIRKSGCKVTVRVGYDGKRMETYSGIEKPEIVVEHDDEISVYPAENFRKALDEINSI